MRVKALLFIMLFLWLGALHSEHPIKMTFSKLTISPKGVVELETRIFLDDLTDHIQELYDLQQADFSTTSSNGTKALQRYIKTCFYFEQDGEKLNLSINAVSLSKNGLALVVKLNTTNPLDVTKEVFLINKLLFDATLMQINDIRYKGKHHRLVVINPKVKIQFD